MTVKVYIAVSLDGYIAGENGDIDWLEKFNDPSGEDYGYSEFIKGIDAVVIGRNTYEKVLSFNAWPYTKKVFVLSSTIKTLPESIKEKAAVLSMPPGELIKYLSGQRIESIYLDGGKTIQRFIKENLVDELIITTIPVLLGAGIPLFGYTKHEINYKHKSTDIYANGLVKSHYLRIKP